MNDLKGVLRLTTTMFLFVGFFGLPGYAEETQEQQVERLIRELQDSDSDIRSIAAVTLGEIGPEAKDAIPALIQLLQDQDAEGFARANAALALGQIGERTEDAMSVLIQALRDQDKYVRRDAAGALEEIGSPRAIKAAKDRYRMVVTLGWIGSEDEIPALIQALQNEDKDVRVNAVVTLGQIESEDVVSVLMEALQDQDEWVRVNAAWTLGQRGERAVDAVPILIRALRDQDEWVRYHAAMALGEIGEGASNAVPALMHALRDQDKHVRRYAVGALGKIGKGTVPALIRTLKNGNVNVPFFATWTLGILRLMIIIGFIGVSGALIITIWFGVVMWKHIVLRIEMESDKGYHSAVKEDYSEYLEQIGVALTALRPAGTAMIDGKRLDVVSIDDFIEVDMLIQVVGVNGAKITVEKSRQQTN
tara:strand:- start:181 stop:1440 length:1260 start_codon:yes stop_codon:yes gene_type:complete